MRYQDEEEFYNEDYENEQARKKEERSKKRFRLFNSQREGKGVSKEDAILPTNFVGFWKRYRRDFSRLLTVNMFYIIGNFPLIFSILALSGIFTVPYTTPSSEIISSIDGITSLSGGNLMVNGIFGAYQDGNAWTLGTYIFLLLGAMTLFTFGFVNVGTSYLIRNMLKGEPVFMWHDFWGAIRRNWKQGLLFGFFDLLILVLIPVNVVILSEQLASENFLVGIMFWANLVIGLLYIFMRFYIYLQMITFDLKIFKILKNSLIFAMIGFKRNILALLGILFLGFLVFACITASGFLLPIGLAIPLILLFSNGSYMSAYAAYFKIKEVMIDPYYKENPPREDDFSDSEGEEILDSEANESVNQ